MRRRGVLVGTWVLVTVAATLVAWAAVGQVTDRVSPRPPLPLPATVAVASEAAGQTPGPAPTDAQDENDAGQQEPDDAGGAATTESYELTGGVVTVRYGNDTSSLVAATPNSGFDVDVHDAGPSKVEVRFRSDDHESRLVARWRNGGPQPQRDERPR